MSETLISRVTAFAGLAAAAGLTAALAASPASAQAIAVGQSINGELTTSDRQLGDGSYFDCYELQTRAGQQVQIDQSSSAFDSFLMVRRGGCNNLGELIAHDDDGGPGLDSRLVLQGDGTVWAIIANSVGGGETGRYQLRVSAAESAQKPGAAAASAAAPTTSTPQLPRVESEWGVEPHVCHAAYTAMVQMRAEEPYSWAPDDYGNVRSIDYAQRASRTGTGLTSRQQGMARTYAENFQLMALVGEMGFEPNGTPNGHRPLAEYLSTLGDCDRANGFTPVTAY